LDQFRPDTWDNYVGQNKLKHTLKLSINGALERDERLDHVLLVGPPGAGKTSLARLIADELGLEFIDIIAPVKPLVMRKVVAYHCGIFFIDEIHRMSTKDQETLLPLLEDQRYQMDNGTSLENDRLTIIGATTEPKKIIKPLWDRFMIKPPFDDYEDNEMAVIVTKMAEVLGLTIPHEQAKILGRATGGVPRAAKQYVKMAQNLGTVEAKEILSQCRVTEDGLTVDHVNYLQVLLNSGGQAGLEILTTHLGLAKELVLDLEKLLVKRNYIEFTKGGRMAMKPAFTLLNKRAH
jgi:Holliday junction DNA helicase RuvB